MSDPLKDKIPAWVDGVLTPVEKLETHLRGLKHKAVSIFITRGDDVLIQKRAAGKYHTPGLWANTCCTHPLWNEVSLDCAHRRLLQELGVTGLDLEFRDQVEYRADVGGGLTEHEVVDIFRAEAPVDLTCNLNPEEVEDVKWVALASLFQDVAKRPDDYTPWLRIYLSEHASRIFDAS